MYIRKSKVADISHIEGFHVGVVITAGKKDFGTSKVIVACTDKDVPVGYLHASLVSSARPEGVLKISFLQSYYQDRKDANKSSASMVKALLESNSHRTIVTSAIPVSFQREMTVLGFKTVAGKDFMVRLADDVTAKWTKVKFAPPVKGPKTYKAPKVKFDKGLRPGKNLWKNSTYMRPLEVLADYSNVDMNFDEWLTKNKAELEQEYEQYKIAYPTGIGSASNFENWAKEEYTGYKRFGSKKTAMQDNLGDFWVVTFPTKQSLLKDIVFQANIFEMQNQFLGGLKKEEIAGVFPVTQQEEAEDLAALLMSEVNSDDAFVDSLPDKIGSLELWATVEKLAKGAVDMEETVDMAADLKPKNEMKPTKPEAKKPESFYDKEIDQEGDKSPLVSKPKEKAKEVGDKDVPTKVKPKAKDDNAHQLEIGKEVEMEHADMFNEMKETVDKGGELPSLDEYVTDVAETHIEEIPNYYDPYLKDMEEQAKKDMGKEDKPEAKAPAPKPEGKPEMKPEGKPDMKAPVKKEKPEASDDDEGPAKAMAAKTAADASSKEPKSPAQKIFKAELDAYINKLNKMGEEDPLLKEDWNNSLMYAFHDDKSVAADSLLYDILNQEAEFEFGSSFYRSLLSKLEAAGYYMENEGSGVWNFVKDTVASKKTADLDLITADHDMATRLPHHQALAKMTPLGFDFAKEEETLLPEEQEATDEYNSLLDEEAEKAPVTVEDDDDITKGLSGEGVPTVDETIPSFEDETFDSAPIPVSTEVPQELAQSPSGLRGGPGSEYLVDPSIPEVKTVKEAPKDLSGIEAAQSTVTDFTNTDNTDRVEKHEDPVHTEKAVPKNNFERKEQEKDEEQQGTQMEQFKAKNDKGPHFEQHTQPQVQPGSQEGMSHHGNKKMAMFPPQVALNMTCDKDGYYISYNPVDVNMYGDVTTAIVTGQMENFYVLNGNHFKDLCALPDLAACMEYFAVHADQVNKYSEKPSAVQGSVKTVEAQSIDFKNKAQEAALRIIDTHGDASVADLAKQTITEYMDIFFTVDKEDADAYFYDALDNAGTMFEGDTEKAKKWATTVGGARRLFLTTYYGMNASKKTADVDGVSDYVVFDDAKDMVIIDLNMISKFLAGKGIAFDTNNYKVEGDKVILTVGAEGMDDRISPKTWLEVDNYLRSNKNVNSIDVNPDYRTITLTFRGMEDAIDIK